MRSVQLTSNFNYLPSTQPAERLMGCTFLSSRQHGSHILTLRCLASKLLSSRLYSFCPRLGGPILRRCPGCEDVPVPSHSTGCAVRQTVNNQRWRTGSDMNSMKRRRWKKRPASSLVMVRVLRAVVVPSMAISSMLISPTRFPSPATRSLCFEPSFTTKSAPFSTARIRKGETA